LVLIEYLSNINLTKGISIKLPGPLGYEDGLLYEGDPGEPGNPGAPI